MPASTFLDAVPVAAKTQHERSRELYKYFQPGPWLEASYANVPRDDPVLLSIAQLAAIRGDARRCFISLLDFEVQYNIAEATRTMDLGDTSICDDPLDNIWVGCNPTGAGRSICQYTLKAGALQTEDGIAHFEALNLAEDPRFHDLPFVAGAPHFRYYFGVPLCTRKGIPIGALCLLDERVREPMSERAKRSFKTMADGVMTHLELLREREEKYRNANIQQCLNLFVNPEVRENDTTASESGLSLSRNVPDAPIKTEKAAHREVFAKSADLLRRALQINEAGGVVFLDTAKSPEQNSSHNERSLASSNGESHHAMNGESLSMTATTDVLGSSVTEDATFSAIEQGRLEKLITLFPRGKLWLVGDGKISSDSDEDVTVHDDRGDKQDATSHGQVDFLLKFFPEACQIIFIPLWDPKSRRMTACFCWSTSNFRYFTYDSDVLCCISFCNCTTVELGRLALVSADSQKGDFISSISHELRSPLHGILGSCEFLHDTDVSSVQRSLIDTVDSCARTLVDTINMVLDYSKINSFDRDWKKAARRSRRSRNPKNDSHRGAARSTSPHPLQSIYAAVDLAAVTEEVVDGVSTGHNFHAQPTMDLHDPHSLPSDTDHNGHSSTNHLTGITTTSMADTNVQVYVDIASGEWTYLTQPGAFRRIVMNIFGNSLKYTSRGRIDVKLELQPGQKVSNSQDLEGNRDEPAPADMVILTVTDTGKGITPEYLRSRLFTAFSQEDHLASGIGLGLSLVQSILSMLNGTIEVESTVNVGTKVVIRIPMVKVGVEGETPSTASSIPNSSVSKDDDPRILRDMPDARTVALFDRGGLIDDQLGNQCAKQSSYQSVRTYVKDWYKMDVVSDFAKADLIIADESDLDDALKCQDRLQHPRPSIVLLCTDASSYKRLIPFVNMGAVGFVSKPFGPHKLAKAIRLCIGRRNTPGLQQPHVANNISEPVNGSLPTVALNSSTTDEQVVNSGKMTVNTERPHALRTLAVRVDGEDTDSTPVFRQKVEEYPFPGHSSTKAEVASPINMDDVASPLEEDRPHLTSRRTISINKQELKELSDNFNHASSMTNAGASILNSPRKSKIPPSSVTPTRSPRLLIVDDNNVNLRLLQAYMKKRKYKNVLSARDGDEASRTFANELDKGTPPDVIFMDISMPIKDGFEATREIRQLEAKRYTSDQSPIDRPAASLIVALTGLASGRDRSDAFTAGVDLYMTKPVSFKEVGRLLDSWETNGGVVDDNVPHGPVTGLTLSRVTSRTAT